MGTNTKFVIIDDTMSRVVTKSFIISDVSTTISDVVSITPVVYSVTGTTNTVTVLDSAGGDAVAVMNLQHKKKKKNSKRSSINSSADDNIVCHSYAFFERV